MIVIINYVLLSDFDIIIYPIIVFTWFNGIIITSINKHVFI